MNLATQNYLVIGVVVAAFAVILPIFFKPYFSSSPNSQKQTPQASRGKRAGGDRSGPRGHPGMEGLRDFPGMHGGRPHMGAPHPGMMADMAAADKQGGSGGGGGGRGGIMTIALPIYSVGIVLYVLYVFYKFYTKGFNNNTVNQRGGAAVIGKGKIVQSNQPSMEQIQNYKQFLLAKEECAKRIAEEKQQQTTGSGDGNSTKLSGNQLVQLELRLKEAEEAMERAMEKMGLDIKQLKQDTGYKDPLADSLEELKRTMANMSAGAHETIPVPAPQPQERREQPKREDSMQKNETVTPSFQAEQPNGDMKPEPVIKFTPPTNEQESLEPTTCEEKTPNVSSESKMESDEGESLAEPSEEANRSRRVSFAEGINIIKQSTIEKNLNELESIAASPITTEAGNTPQQQPETIEACIEEVNKVHPATEPEGLYLGKLVLAEDESIDSPITKVAPANVS